MEANGCVRLLLLWSKHYLSIGLQPYINAKLLDDTATTIFFVGLQFLKSKWIGTMSLSTCMLSEVKYIVLPLDAT